jgi:hypothetical protein
MDPCAAESAHGGREEVRLVYTTVAVLMFLGFVGSMVLLICGDDLICLALAVLLVVNWLLAVCLHSFRGAKEV